MFTCGRFIAHALTGRLKRGAIKRFEVQSESCLMLGSNLHHRLSKAGSKANRERAGYTVFWFENKYSLSFTELPEF